MKSIGQNILLSVIRKSCHILFPLLIFPYVSRVLGPEGYGTFSYANSLISYFLMAAMLGISTYAVREGTRIRDDKENLEKFLNEVSTINLLSLVVVSIVMYVFIALNRGMAKDREILLVLSVILPATFLGRDWINTIFEDYLYITVRYIVIQIIGLFAIFVFVREETDCLTYTIIYMLTVTVGYAVNLFYTRRYVKFRLTCKLQLRKHIVPIMIIFGGQAATNIYIQSDITLIGVFQSESEVGIYAVASKIYVLVKDIVGTITTVVIPRLVYYLGKQDDTRFRIFTNKLYNYLLIMVIPLMVGVFFLSKEFLWLVGGKEYIGGEEALKILSIALVFAVFAGFYCNAVLVPKRKEKEYLIITVIAAIVNIVLNCCFVPYIGIMGAAVTTLISEIVVFVMGLKKTKSILSVQISAHSIVTIIIGSIAVAAVCMLSKLLFDGCVWRVIFGVSVSAIMYLIILILLKNEVAMSIIKRTHIDAKE